MFGLVRSVFPTLLAAFHVTKLVCSSITYWRKSVHGTSSKIATSIRFLGKIAIFNWFKPSLINMMFGGRGRMLQSSPVEFFIVKTNAPLLISWKWCMSKQKWHKKPFPTGANVGYSILWWGPRSWVTQRDILGTRFFACCVAPSFAQMCLEACWQHMSIIYWQTAHVGEWL